MKPAFRKIPESGGWRALPERRRNTLTAATPGRVFHVARRGLWFAGTGGPEFTGAMSASENYLERRSAVFGRGPTASPATVRTTSVANIDIINEQRCTQCHTYERARTMKQALFETERKLWDIEKALKKLSSRGMYTAEEDKTLFRTEAEFRTLFHTVDVSLVQEKTDGFARQLDMLQNRADSLFAELQSRKNFSGMLMLLLQAQASLCTCLQRPIGDPGRVGTALPKPVH
jgi:hypothetical protein